MNRVTAILALVLFAAMGAWYLVLGPRPEKEAIEDIQPFPDSSRRPSAPPQNQPKDQDPAAPPLSSQAFLQVKKRNLEEIARIEANFLSSPESARKMSLKDWEKKTGELQWELGAKQRKVWANLISEAWMVDLEKLGPEDFCALAAVVLLLDEPLAFSLIRTWFGGQAWESAPPLSQAFLARSMAKLAGQGYHSGGQTWGLADLQQVEKNCQKGPPLPLAGRMDLGWAFVYLNENQKAKAWAESAFQSAVAEDVPALASLHELCRLGLKAGGFPPAEKEYLKTLERSFQSVLSSSEIPDCALLAAPVRSPEGLASLRRPFLAKDPIPLPEWPRIAAWAHYRAGELAAWKAYLQQQKDDGAQDQEKLLFWTLAESYATGLSGDQPAPHRRLPLLKEAERMASTPQGRLAILGEWACYYRDTGAPGEGAALVAKSKGGLENPALRAAERLEEVLWKEAEDLQTCQERNVKRQEMAHQYGKLGYLRDCLKRAEATGDEAGRQRFATAIGELERELLP